MKYPRRGNRRRYAIALGLCFHPETLLLLHRAAQYRTVQVGEGMDCATLREAWAVLPAGGMAWIVPGHRER